MMIEWKTRSSGRRLLAPRAYAASEVELHGGEVDKRSDDDVECTT